MNDNVLLETRNLSKIFRTGRDEVRAVNELSMTIEAGSFTALTGPSGCGKTTLLSLLGALERPTSGQVIFRGRELNQFSDVELARLRRRMGFIFQNFSLIPGLPVWENVTYPLVPRGIRARDRWALAEKLLARLGMADKLARRPRELSGGEQQRVAIARALVGEPEIILADEPISNLDQENGRAVLSFLQEIHADGKTVVVSVHDLSILSMASVVHELRAGRLKQ